MINLKDTNAGAHIGGCLWLLGNTKYREYSPESLIGLMKISINELGLSADGQPAPSNKCYQSENNPWGMACISKRETTSDKCGRTNAGSTGTESFAHYPTVYKGVEDVFYWMKSNKIPNDVASSKNPSDIITFAESKGWYPKMDAHRAISTDKAKGFIDTGRNAFFVRVGLFATLSIIVLSLVLKPRARAKMKKALGPLGGLVKSGTTTVRRKVKRTATRTAVRARRSYRRMRAKKS
jgi:hypothetical protein